MDRPLNATCFKKELNHKHIAFSMARVPGSGHYYHGASDSGVYQVDHSHEKPEAKRFTVEGHSSYILGTANSRHLFTGGWDKNLIWWSETGKAVRKQKPTANGCAASGFRLAANSLPPFRTTWCAAFGQRKPVACWQS